VITFTSTLGTLEPATGTALTNTSGDAIIKLLASTTEGAGVLTAVSSGGVVITQGFYTQGDGAVQDKTISLAISSPNVSDAVPATLTATVLDKGMPVQGKLVEFRLDITLAGLLDAEYAYTDVDGKATVTLRSDNQSGIGIVTASVVDGNDSGSDNYYGYAKLSFITAGDGAVQDKTISLAITSPNVSDAFPATLTATVLDKGVPVVNQIVEFDTTLGYFELGSYAFTDENGEARVILEIANDPGIGIAGASFTDFGSDFNYDRAEVGFVSAGDGAVQDKTISLAISSPNVSVALPATLTATVLDKGVPVLGEVITFTSTLGILDPVIGTAITKAGGVATIILSAGEEEGAGVISAMTTTGESDNVGFETAGDGVGSGINIRVILTNSLGDVVDQISSISSGTLTALVTGVTEAVIVTFTTDMGSIPIPTAIATAGSNFEASVELLSGNSLGAGTINVSLISGETDNLVFSIGASDLGIGNAIDAGTGLPDGLIGVPNSNISAGSTAGLTVRIWDVSNASVGTPAVLFTTETVEVTFSSGCSNLTTPTAIIDSPVSTKGGIAQSTYLAQGCEDDDTVTATANAGGTTLSATGVITIDNAANGSIEFISATPQLISLKGVGGTESSTVVFRVLDTNGNPVSNENVSFSLNTTVGGITFSPTAADTDSNGLVQTVINSGSVHTSVRVRAELTNNSAIFTQSSLLVISTGIPDQDSFSLSASVFNPEAWNIDGTEVTITARLADAFNNPAPDGTAVAFTTEGGAIEDSCVTTKGVCSVIWTSQNVRPDGQKLGETNNGPTMVKGTVDISNGLDFTNRAIVFHVTSNGATDIIDLRALYSTKFDLLKAVNDALLNTSLIAASGFEDVFELISTDGFDIDVTDASIGAVTTQDLLGVADGTTYYFDPTTIVGSVMIDYPGRTDPLDFTGANDIEFDVTANGLTDTVTLNQNYLSVAAIVSAINIATDTNDVVATTVDDNYITLTSAFTIDIVNGAGTNTTEQGLGFSDGSYSLTTVSSVNLSSNPMDFSANDVKFNVATSNVDYPVTLDAKYSSVSDILTKINDDLPLASDVIATEYVYASASYIVLSSDTRLDIKVTNDITGGITTEQGLGFSDGSTFATRVNSSSPQTTNFMAQKYGGRATISATAIGEESFPDLNGNGVYDSSEEDAFLGNNGSDGLDINGVPFDLAESFVDNNEDSVYNPEPSAGYGETGGELEKFDDFNTSGTYDLKDDKYNGSLCGTALNCSTDKSLNVRGTVVLVMSGSHPRFVTTYPLNGENIDIIQDGTAAASVIIADIHNQPMPAGTTVAFEAAVGSILGISTYTWPSESSNRGSSYPVTVKGVEDKTLSGPLTVTVTTPGGTATTYIVATISITPS
jgi:hypothetical protein